MTEALLALAIQETPALIARIKEVFGKQNPGVPPPTDAEVIAAYEAAFASSLAKDDAWLKAHPPR